MMSDPFGFDAALRELEAEQDPAQVIRWNGADYPCILGPNTLSRTLGFGGFAPDADMQAVLRRSVFAEDIPESAQDVTAQGRLLGIQSVTASPCGTFLVLSLVDAGRGV